MRRGLAVVMLMAAMGTHGADAAKPEREWIKIGLAVTDEIVAKDWAKLTARFDAKMKAALPGDTLAAVWTQAQAQMGAFRRVEKTALTQSGGYHRVVVTCAMERLPIDITIALDDAGQIAGLLVQPANDVSKWQPPPYGKSPADERAVTVGPAGLPGKLLLPKGPGPWPAVVLVHGSGPHDEDETIAGSRPFRDLALGLAGHGIASLRYVKRTKHAPAAFAAGKRFTLEEETIADARAAVALLASTPPVDPTRVWVLGHSLGGYVAPRIAKGDPHVAGIVILAGSTRPLEDIVVEQMKFLSRGEADGAAKVAEAEATARAVRDPKLTEATVVDFLGVKMPGAYFLDMRRYDPAATAAALPIPILVLQGERDFQVGRADYDGWAKALSARPNATLKLYPTLNHLFESGQGPPDPAEYMQPGQHVAEEVVRDIAAFVGKARPRPGK